MIDWKKAVAGAVSGFVGAFLADLHAWSKGGGTAFDWSKALPRWVSGLVSGALTGIGMGGL